MSNPEGNVPMKPSSHVKMSALDLDNLPHSTSDYDLLYRIYASKRIDAQVDFYQSRIKENEKNADFTFGMGTLVMTISSLVATISASVRDPFWTPALTVTSAILPAFAALLAAFRQLYGWERQINIYRDALLGLERVRLLAPDDDRVEVHSLTNIYPELVTKSETVFTGEVSQWGQYLVDTEGEAAKGDAVMKQFFGSLNLTDEQRETIQSILVAGKTGDVSISANIAQSAEVAIHSEAEDGGGGTVTTSVSTSEAASLDAEVVTEHEPENLPFEAEAADVPSIESEIDAIEGEIVDEAETDEDNKAVG